MSQQLFQRWLHQKETNRRVKELARQAIELSRRLPEAFWEQREIMGRGISWSVSRRCLDLAFLPGGSLYQVTNRLEPVMNGLVIPKDQVKLLEIWIDQANTFIESQRKR